jgi:hypothetical protein
MHCCALLRIASSSLVPKAIRRSPQVYSLCCPVLTRVLRISSTGYTAVPELSMLSSLTYVRLWRLCTGSIWVPYLVCSACSFHCNSTRMICDIDACSEKCELSFRACHLVCFFCRELYIEDNRLMNSALPLGVSALTALVYVPWDQALCFTVGGCWRMQTLNASSSAYIRCDVHDDAGHFPFSLLP